MSSLVRPRAESFPSEQIFEHVGVVVVDLWNEKVCILVKTENDEEEYILPRGRRMANQSRIESAKTQAEEITGYAVEPLKLKVEVGFEEVPGYRYNEVNHEPLYLSTRRYEYDVETKWEGRGRDKLYPHEPVEMHLYWWFVVDVRTSSIRTLEDCKVGNGDEAYVKRWVRFGDAAEMMSYEQEKEIVRRALWLVERL